MAIQLTAGIVILLGYKTQGNMYNVQVRPLSSTPPLSPSSRKGRLYTGSSSTPPTRLPSLMNQTDSGIQENKGGSTIHLVLLVVVDGIVPAVSVVLLVFPVQWQGENKKTRGPLLEMENDYSHGLIRTTESVKIAS